MAKVILDFNEPVPLTEEEDEETLAAIDRGIKDADEGRTVSLDEARKMIPKWISRFESRKRR
jgi:predicted transcriptional regulator